MRTEARIDAATNAHWYTREGEPFHTVIGANGKERDTNLRDARKLNLLPSVTSILKVLAKPGLESWKTEQAVLSVMTAPRIPGEDDGTFVRRVLRDERQQDQEAASAAATGAILHEEIADGIRQRKPVSTATEPVYDALRPYLKDRAESHIEEIVVNHGLGYAGRCDYYEVREDGSLLVVDFKTTKNIPEKPYLEHGLQLTAYMLAVNHFVFGTLLGVYVSTTEQGLVKVHEWPISNDLVDGVRAVACLWKLVNNYDPCRSEKVPF